MKARIGSSHLGICVSDLDRSVRFYTEVLAADELALYSLDEVMPKTYRFYLETPANTRAFSKFLAIDGLLIELLYYTRGGSPAGYIGPAKRRPMNQLGFTHLALRISDVDEFKATLEKVEKYGGIVVKGGRIIAEVFDGEPIECVFVTDPDGTRVELMRMPDHYPVGNTVYRRRRFELDTDPNPNPPPVLSRLVF